MHAARRRRLLVGPSEFWIGLPRIALDQARCGRNPRAVGAREEGNASMFSHIMIGTNDLEKAKDFYDKLLGTLGVAPGRVDRHRVFYRTPTGTFGVTKPIDGNAA